MENKQIKIKLWIAIVIAIAIIAIICILSVMYFKIDNKGKNEIGKEIENKNITTETFQENNELQTPTISKKEDIKYSDFDYEFLKLENEKQNLIYSPLSIKYALNMLNKGANGNTKSQIEDVIGNLSLTKYNNIKDILSLANAIYIRNNYSEYIKDEYNNNITNQYNAEVKYDDFESANNINNWIEDKTFGQIKNMVSNETVTNPDSKVVLINALAIDMEWKEKFDEKVTLEGTFYLDNGDSITATMMNKTTKSNNFSYYKDDDITALSIDLKQYENEQMEFIAIMPNSDLSNYIENFNVDEFENITDNLTLASNTKNGLNISIPRFSFDYNLKLNEDLKALGITDAFSADLADFSNMSTKNSLYVSDALHKANIDFSEKGIKAAAVTVIIMEDGMLVSDNENKPIQIKIDKPFIYLIRDKKTNEIWFVGTVYTPDLWENDKADYEIY